MNAEIYNGDCLDPDRRIKDASVDLGIYDPPFGLGEVAFGKHYKRDSDQVVPGYQEAPKDYGAWTRLWMGEAQRVLKPDGSMYVISGHTNLRHILNAAAELGLREINHCIWKYNFGVNTTKKYVTSHYHVLYYAKGAKTTFNTHCRHGSQELEKDGKGKTLYRDLEDVFVIQKDYSPGKKKNMNKLPEELIRKLVLYSSNKNDLVCDFFMGNFTTAYVALKLGRRVCGYEANKNSYDYHKDNVRRYDMEMFGREMPPPVEDKRPKNQGKPITDEERRSILEEYKTMVAENKEKRDISLFLQEKFGRGRFAIKNILDEGLKKDCGAWNDFPKKSLDLQE